MLVKGCTTTTTTNQNGTTTSVSDSKASNLTPPHLYNPDHLTINTVLTTLQTRQHANLTTFLFKTLDSPVTALTLALMNPPPTPPRSPQPQPHPHPQPQPQPHSAVLVALAVGLTSIPPEVLLGGNGIFFEELVDFVDR